MTNRFYAKDKVKELKIKEKKNIKSMFLNHEDLRLMTTKHACICKNHQSMHTYEHQPRNVSKPKNLTVKSKPRKMQ